MYQLSTLKKRPGVVSRVELGELEVEVAVTTREEVLELLRLTNKVTLVLQNWICDEIKGFRKIVWLGRYDSRLRDIWHQLDKSAKIKFSAFFPELAIQEDDLQMQLTALIYTRDPDILRNRARSDRDMFRLAIARNPSCPPDVLEQLSQDTNEFVLTNIARNPNSPETALRKLAQHPSALVRRALLLNSKSASPKEED